MRISFEGKIAIFLALLFGVGSAIVLIYPGVGQGIGIATLAVSILGMILLAAHHANDLRVRAMEAGRGLGKMVSFIVFCICLAGVVGFGAWHFWPQTKTTAPPVNLVGTNPHPASGGKPPLSIQDQLAEAQLADLKAKAATAAAKIRREKLAREAQARKTDRRAKPDSDGSTKHVPPTPPPSNAGGICNNNGDNHGNMSIC